MAEISTVLNQREITEDGTVQVRIEKRVTNGDVVVSSQWHRVSFPPGCDVDSITAAVDAHLPALGFPAMSANDWQKVKDTISHVQTPEVVAAYQAMQAADV